MLELDFCLLQSCMHAKLLQLCMTLRPMDYSLPDSSVYGDSPDKNAGVGCHALFQGIFPTQGSNLHLMSPALAGKFFTTSATWEAHLSSKSLKYSTDLI